MISKVLPSFKRCRVHIDYSEVLPIEQVVTNIARLESSQVIIWYIGYYGFRKAGAEFYKNFLIEPVLELNSKTTFWLVDLTAWSIFKNIQYFLSI